MEINGSVQKCTQMGMLVYDIAHQSNSTIVVSREQRRILSSAKDWSSKSEKTISNDTGASFPYLTVSSENEIIAANRNDRIHIFDPTGSTRKHSIAAVEKPYQALATKSGVIVSSSCNYNNSSRVRVYDRDGKSGDPIAAKDGEHLYPAVDGEDRVFIASVNKPAGRIQITLYRPEGLELRKAIEFEELELTLSNTWCYLVCLSRNTLAFACGTKVYFLNIPHGTVPLAAE